MENNDVNSWQLISRGGVKFSFTNECVVLSSSFLPCFLRPEPCKMKQRIIHAERGFVETTLKPADAVHKSSAWVTTGTNYCSQRSPVICWLSSRYRPSREVWALRSQYSAELCSNALYTPHRELLGILSSPGSRYGGLIVGSRAACISARDSRGFRYRSTVSFQSFSRSLFSPVETSFSQSGYRNVPAGLRCVSEGVLSCRQVQFSAL